MSYYPNYDAWKLATPPEYERDGEREPEPEEFDCEPCGGPCHEGVMHEDAYARWLAAELADDPAYMEREPCRS